MGQPDVRDMYVWNISFSFCFSLSRMRALALADGGSVLYSPPPGDLNYRVTLSADAALQHMHRGECVTLLTCC